MNELSKAAKINFLAFIGYTVVLRAIALAPDAGFGAAAMNALLIVIHSIILISKSVSEFAHKEKEKGQASLLCGLVILLVGMPTCFFAYIMGFKM